MSWAGQASPRRKDLSWDMHDGKTLALWRARVSGRTAKHEGSEMVLSWVYSRRRRKIRVAVGM